MATTSNARRGVALEDDPFALESIVRSEPPEGSETRNWHRYVITQGANTIVGHVQGTQAAAQRSVLEIIDRLNERRRGKTGRVHLSPGRKKKGTPPPDPG